MIVEPREDDVGWWAYDDELRIMVTGMSEEEAVAAFTDALAERRRECAHQRDSWFDRTLCSRDGWMHTYCADCGVPLDGLCGQEAKRA